MSSRDSIRAQLESLDANDPGYAASLVDHLLTAARELAASDVHIHPVGDGYEILWRCDGVLESVGTFPAGASSDPVVRLKALAELLTYKQETPQEGRLRDPAANVEMRVSTFPTLHGERAVVRLFAPQQQLQFPEELGFPSRLAKRYTELLAETSGALVVVGPAGSGKTTTLYAGLRHILRSSARARSAMTLEDPIESVVPGLSQSQVNVAAGFDYPSGLRSLMRQDPEVLLIGEIRDRHTAEIALQASLTGHLVLTSFHAGSAAGAIGRLLDMGIEPYALRSGLLAVIAQRLLRRVCQCGTWSQQAADSLGLPVERTKIAGGCSNCPRSRLPWPHRGGRDIACDRAAYLRPDLPGVQYHGAAAGGSCIG